MPNFVYKEVMWHKMPLDLAISMVIHPFALHLLLLCTKTTVNYKRKLKKIIPVKVKASQYFTGGFAQNN